MAGRRGRTEVFEHASASLLGSVQLRIFDDRLEVWNPGSLPAPFTVEDLKRPHDSLPRNPRVADAFFQAGFIEAWGSGTLRMIDWCRDAGNPEPEFESGPRTFVVTFRPSARHENQLLGAGKRAALVREWIAEHGSISRREYEDAAGVSRRTAARDLKELVQRGVLRSVGAGKTCRYVP